MKCWPNEVKAFVNPLGFPCDVGAKSEGFT